MGDIDDEIIEPAEPAGMMMYVRRRPDVVGGVNTYPIVELKPYTNVSNHGDFFKFRVTDEQGTLLKNKGSDLLLLDLLKVDFPESDFLGEDYNDDIRDIRGYDMLIEKYIQIVEPVDEVEV